MDDNVLPFLKPIKNTKDLQEAFEIKAKSCGLTVDCPADGMFNAEIAIIAEAPGEREVEGKAPLIGGSGSLLWTILRQQGITRNDCYVTNLAKRQVAFDRDERRAPLGRHEFNQWNELLLWELQQLPNLRIVVLLGNFALKALTGNEGITSWRGSVLDVSEHFSRPVTAVTSFNPAAVLREPKNELIYKLDMSRVKRVREGRWKPHEIRAFINPTLEQARDYLADLRRTDSPIAFDIETMGGETACIGFANNPHEGFSINFRGLKEQFYTVEEERIIRRDIQGLLGDQSKQLIAQNGGFDCSWLWFKDKIKVAPLWLDTMLAHHCLYPQMPHGLGFLCTQYTTHPYYKDEKDLWREGGNIDQFWEYNVKDCCITWAAANKMVAELQAQSLDKFFFEHVMRLQPHLIRMTVGGVKVDVTLKENIKEELSKDVDVYREKFKELARIATGDPDLDINPNSPAQLSNLFFNKLRLVGRGASTNDENRKRMYKDHRTPSKAREMLDALDKYKEEAKFFSTYVDSAIDEDDRCRSDYKQTGVQAAPGRLSSAKTLWGHYDEKARCIIQHGMNMQNQPRRAYEMFIADPAGTYFDGVDMREYPDYTFIYFDGSQAEARYVAYDAGIESWIDQFNRDIEARLTGGSYDAHRALAAQIFDMNYDDVPTEDEIDGIKTPRYKGKRARHGLNYRMMPDRFSSTAGIAFTEAQRIWEVYHRLHPELRKWWRDIENEARKTRMLFNSFGRRLFIQGRLDDPETLESIVAFRPQSTIGDKVCQVIYQAESDDKWPKEARMAMNIHDALIGICPVDKAKTACAIMKKHMETPIIVKPSMPPLVIPADTGIAEPDKDGVRRWSTIKKVKL